MDRLKRHFFINEQDRINFTARQVHFVNSLTFITFTTLKIKNKKQESKLPVEQRDFLKGTVSEI